MAIKAPDVPHPSGLVDENCESIQAGIYHGTYPREGLGALLKTGRKSDLTFVVEGRELRAHRIIVACQCDYFDSLLYGGLRESKSSKIKLEDTPWQAFQVLLEYMYTGQIQTLEFQTCVDLLTLADRYNFSLLHRALEELLCDRVAVGNILQLMFCADACNARRLYAHCSSLIDLEAEAVLASKGILDLPVECMKVLLSRDTFVVNEVKIVEAVRRWREHNDFSLDEIVEVLGSIRLSEISYEDMNEVVCSSGLYPRRILDTAFQKKKGSVMGKPRGNIVSNLFAAPCQVRVSSNVEMLGSPRYMPPSRLQFRLCSNVPSDDATSIIFKFDNLYLINHLQFDGLPEVKGESDFSKELRNPFLYVVDVSSDSVHWERVIDHSVCKCYHSQDLYFPCVAVRSVRLLVTKSHANLQLTFSGCGLADDAANRFRFYEGGSLAPVHRLSPKCMTHWVPERMGKRGILTFHQPYHISCIRFRVKGMEKNPNHLAQVLVKVSLYNKSRYFVTVAKLHQSLDEEIAVKFEEQLVSLVTVTIPCYYNSQTGKDLADVLEGSHIEIVNFSIMHDVNS